VTVARLLVRPPGRGGSPEWPVVALVGEVDLSNVDQIDAGLRAAVPGSAAGLVLDLSGVDYLDSTGLRLLFRLAREMRDRQQELQLVVPTTSRLRRVLELGGVPGTIAVVVPQDRANQGTAS
jgi:anti-anti-sigma factor